MSQYDIDSTVNEIRYQQRNKKADAMQLALQSLADALQGVTNHLAQVLDGPIMRGCGVRFPDGTDNVPTIKQARAALKNAEPFLKEPK